MIDELIDASGAGCEVRSTKNDLLFFGRIHQSDGVTVSVVNASGSAVPIIIYNTEVKLVIRGLRRRKEPAPLVLFGKICGSNRTLWKVDRLNPFNFAEQREAYRQRITVPIRALCVNSIYKPEEPPRAREFRPIMCRLIDISMTGALFSTREHFEREDWLLLMDVRLVRGTTPFILTSQVRRTEELGNRETAYGCKFTHLTPTERDRLVRMIFDLQREDIAGHRDLG